MNGRSAASLRGNCAQRTDWGRYGTTSPRSPQQSGLGSATAHSVLKPEHPPRLPSAPPRPACAFRHRRPSCSRSGSRPAFPPLPSAYDCFRVQKPPIRAAVQWRQFRNQAPPPKEGEGTKAPPPGLGWTRPLGFNKALPGTGSLRCLQGPAHCPAPVLVALATRLSNLGPLTWYRLGPQCILLAT